MLFLPLHDVESTTAQLTEARPLINDLAHDPSLTGLANLLTSTLLLPLEIGRVKLSGLAPLLDHSATVLDRVQENQHAPLSWRAVADPSTTLPARSFILVQAVLDYASLKAGGSATELIRKTGTSLNLEAKYGVHIHLTGEQPPSPTTNLHRCSRARHSMASSCFLLCSASSGWRFGPRNWCLTAPLRANTVIFDVSRFLAFDKACRTLDSSW